MSETTPARRVGPARVLTVAVIGIALGFAIVSQSAQDATMNAATLIGDALILGSLALVGFYFARGAR